MFYFRLLTYVVFFFFKQKPAYELRISDWSSDVCSSDLDPTNVSVLAAINHVERSGSGVFEQQRRGVPQIHHHDRIGNARFRDIDPGFRHDQRMFAGLLRVIRLEKDVTRSEERRYGKEGVSTCRYRWWPSH